MNLADLAFKQSTETRETEDISAVTHLLKPLLIDIPNNDAELQCIEYQFLEIKIEEKSVLGPPQRTFYQSQ